LPTRLRSGKAVENALLGLRFQASDLPPPVETAGRIGPRQGKVLEFTLIFLFVKGVAASPLVPLTRSDLCDGRTCRAVAAGESDRNIWTLMASCLLAISTDIWPGGRLNGMLDEPQLYRACYELLVVTALKLLWDGVSGYIG
jgi:hypothetical protein